MFRNPYTDGLIVVLILLLFFGPKRLPSLGRSLGQGLREFKQSITGESEDSERPEITKASAPSEERAPGSEATPAQAGSPADHAG
jgi:sec-independent protein translocase protein TatA